MPDIGELAVGAWLTEVEGYDFVVYNQHPGKHLPPELTPPGPEGVSARLAELDVIGLNTVAETAYLAECTTHVRGLQYGGGTEGALRKLKRKFQISGAYASVLEERSGLTAQLALWSPKVSRPILDRAAELNEAAGRPVELVTNEEYAGRVRTLIGTAAGHATMTGNEFFRTLQLLTHLPGVIEAPRAKQTAIAAKQVPATVFAAERDSRGMTNAQVADAIQRSLSRVSELTRSQGGSQVVFERYVAALEAWQDIPTVRNGPIAAS